MNENDSEIVAAILQKAGHKPADSPASADILLLNTCAVREGAEQKVLSRLDMLRHQHKLQGQDQMVGVLGCMAERMKDKLLEHQVVDLVAGPDAYRDLPRLLQLAEGGQTAINVMLSADETYADITPVRKDKTGVSGLVSIMRGCENLCAFCIVPYTRGKERSRSADSIMEEVRQLADAGYKEVLLLGQNVNSYNDLSRRPGGERKLAATKDALSRGFRNISRRPVEVFGFTALLDKLSAAFPEMRFRFTSPHPKDFPDALLDLMAERPNLCKQIHLPAQSGSTSVLERMRRGYTREAYLELVQLMRSKLPGLALSTDIIAGFCGETEEEHQDTVSLMRIVGYDQAFMFMYSDRERTYAARHYKDDVPEAVKKRRLQEIIDTFHAALRPRNEAEVGRLHLVLVEGDSRKSSEQLAGRADNNKRIVFPKAPVPQQQHLQTHDAPRFTPKPGDFVAVRVTGVHNLSLLGTPVCLSSISQFETLKRLDATGQLQQFQQDAPKLSAVL